MQTASKRLLHTGLLVIVLITLLLPWEFEIGAGIQLRLFDLSIAGVFLYLICTQGRRVWQLFCRPIPIAYVLFCLFAFLSVTLQCWGETARLLKGWMLCVRLMEPCLCYLMIRVLYQSDMQKTLGKAFFILATIAAVFASVTCVLQVDAFSAEGTLFLNGVEYRRAGGFLDDAVAFGFQCGLILVISIFALWKPDLRREYLSLAILALVSNGVALFLSASRSPMIFVCLAIGYLLLFGGQKRARNLCIIMIAGLVGAGVLLYCTNAFPGVNDYIDQRILSLFQMNQENASAVSSERLQIWEHYLSALSGNSWKEWLFGHGVGVFEHSIGATTLYPNGKLIATNMSTHNTYLGALVGGGILGLFSFAALWAFCVLQAIKYCRKSGLGLIMLLCMFAQMFLCDAMGMTAQMCLILGALGFEAQLGGTVRSKEQAASVGHGGQSE